MNKYIYNDGKTVKFIIENARHGDKTVTIDRSQYHRVKRFSWHLMPRRDKTGKFYVYTKSSKRKSLYLHRYLLDVFHRDIEVDHIDGDPLNNRLENLRTCARGENSRNLIVERKNNTSGYKGVSWDKQKKRFIAYIYINREQKYLGCFASKTDAAKRYNLEAKKIFGDFAKLNEI